VETRESVNELVDHSVASIAGGRLEWASDIVMLRASEMARAIKCRDVSCCEMMQAHLKHIDWLNPIVHALRLGVEQAELIARWHITAIPNCVEENILVGCMDCQQ
jgi:hypothetical protein